jgi:hypothetical protein
MRAVGTVLKATVFALSIVVLWIAVAIVLWWAYDFSAFIKGGAYTRQSAEIWVGEFAAIVSILIGIVWGTTLIRDRSSDVSILMAAWKALWRTALVLFLYAAVIMARRYSWLQGRGEDDWSMFFGRVNAVFFSEVGPLSYFIEVFPAASLISAVLYSAQVACIRKLGESSRLSR